MKRLLLLLLLACGPHDVVVAMLPPGDPPGAACETATDCGPETFCEKPGCEAVVGHCMPVPPMCPPPVGGPVCGCDHVTYAGECARRAAGIASQTPGACP